MDIDDDRIYTHTHTHICCGRADVTGQFVLLSYIGL